MAISDKSKKTVSPTRFAEFARECAGKDHSLVRLTPQGEPMEVSAREIGQIPGIYQIISTKDGSVFKECSTLSEQQQPSGSIDQAQVTNAWMSVTGKFESGLQMYMDRDKNNQAIIDALKAEIVNYKDKINELIISLASAKEEQTTEISEIVELIRDFAPMLIEQNGIRLLHGKIREIAPHMSEGTKNELVKLLNSNPSLPASH